MSMTDPIADMLTRIRNAAAAGHRTLQMPASRTKRRLAEILRDEGYISDFSLHKSDEQINNMLHIDLKWLGSQPAIEGIRRESKPGQRKYARCEQIPKVRNGLGVMIVSTSKGMMSDRAARKAGVGGELICSVW